MFKIAFSFKLQHDVKRVQIQRVITGRHFSKYSQVAYQNAGQNMNINLSHIRIYTDLTDRRPMSLKLGFRPES